MNGSEIVNAWNQVLKGTQEVKKSEFLLLPNKENYFRLFRLFVQTTPEWAGKLQCRFPNSGNICTLPQNFLQRSHYSSNIVPVIIPPTTSMNACRKTFRKWISYRISEEWGMRGARAKTSECLAFLTFQHYKWLQIIFTLYEINMSFPITFSKTMRSRLVNTGYTVYTLFRYYCINILLRVLTTEWVMDVLMCLKTNCAFLRIELNIEETRRKTI